MTAYEKAVSAAATKFNEACRAADAAYGASDRGTEAGDRWRAAIRKAQDTVRTERNEAERSRRQPAGRRSR